MRFRSSIALVNRASLFAATFLAFGRPIDEIGPHRIRATRGPPLVILGHPDPVSVALDLHPQFRMRQQDDRDACELLARAGFNRRAAGIE